MKTLYRGVELLSRNQTSAFLGREKRTWATRMSYGEALLSLRLTTQAGVKESMMPGTFCLFAQKGRNLRPPVYWPCIISVHQESCLQRWTLLRTVLWMGKIKGVIRVRFVEASMLHLTVSIKGIIKITPPPLPHHHQHHGYLGDEGRRSYSLSDLKLCQNSGKVIIFSLTRETYTNMRTEILPPLPLSCVQTFPPPPPTPLKN